MLRSATVSQIRAAEEPLLAAGVPLMQQAAQAIAAAVKDDGFTPPANVVLLVGAGNNGGDALWAGSYLASEGYQVTAYLLAEGAHPEGLAALQANGGQVFRVPTTLPLAVAGVQAAHADVIIDGILGIGASGGLRGVAGELVQAITEYWGGGQATWFPNKPWVIAVDCPSGITLDGPGAGQVPGPVLNANHTITFGAPKPGLELPPASHAVGKLSVFDLGLGLQEAGNGFPAQPAEPGLAGTATAAASPQINRLTARDVAEALRVPGPADHKYSRGVVGVAAGTSSYPGAAVLATSGALLSGAGMVRYLGPSSVSQLVISAHPEVVLGGGQVQAWVLGPGVPTASSGSSDDGQLERIKAALSQAAGTLPGVGGAVPAVVDAGALPAITKPLPPWVVLTPHAGELATLLTAHGLPTKRAEVEANPLQYAQKAQQLLGGTVLLKGSTTLVVGPGNLIYSQAEAPNWLATAGAGDVLAGLLGTLLAARSAEVVAEPGLAAEIAAAAVYLHSTAAKLVNPGGPITASGVAQAIPAAIAQVLENR